MNRDRTILEIKALQPGFPQRRAELIMAEIDVEGFHVLRGNRAIIRRTTVDTYEITYYTPAIHRHELDTDPESEHVTPYNCPVCGITWARSMGDGNWVER